MPFDEKLTVHEQDAHAGRAADRRNAIRLRMLAIAAAEAERRKTEERQAGSGGLERGALDSSG